MDYPLPFGRYLLLERINVGGMAEVFKAKAFGVEGFERILAIKRILPNMAEDDEFINMFVDEARIAVQLSHANIVQIYELGKFESQYYIAMEYVSGRDLRQLLDHFRKRDKLLPVPAAAFLISKICDGLDYAHRKADPTGKALNVIHRDVSPQNILVGYEGAVKITDFGIAKAEDRASKTQAGVLKGKFGYMSPEQVRGLTTDHRSDIFTVGILLYEMVTGQRLFLGESDFSTLEKVRNADIKPPIEINPDVLPELEAIVLKALAKEKNERYTWASELHDDLQQFLIEDNTIYNAKRLAALMQEEYQDGIDAEKRKMEDFMRMSAPAVVASSIEAQVSHVSTSGVNIDSRRRNDETMIFESDLSGLSEMPTQISQVSQSGSNDGWASTSGVGSWSKNDMRLTRGNEKQQVISLRPSLSEQSDVDTGLTRRRNLGWLMIIGAVFVSVLILFITLVISPSPKIHGALIVKSTPTARVDVYLDGELIDKKTPIIKSDIPVGEHVLLARSEGFRDRIYRFELLGGEPAEINIELEAESNSQKPTPGELTIVSDPSGAEVWVADIKKGITPLTLTHKDTREAVNFKLIKDGFDILYQSFQFPENKHQAMLRVPLPASTGNISEVASRFPGKVKIQSKPVGAQVWINNELKGMTPLRLRDLSVDQSYQIEIQKEGFHSAKKSIRLDHKSEINLDFVLKKQSQRAKIKSRAKHKIKQRNKENCSGGGAKLGVMPVGEQNCEVIVGKRNLGIAPIFNKDAPIGRCRIEVKCPSGKFYSTMKNLKSQESVKVIIKTNDWKKK